MFQGEGGEAKKIPGRGAHGHLLSASMKVSFAASLHYCGKKHQNTLVGTSCFVKPQNGIAPNQHIKK